MYTLTKFSTTYLREPVIVDEIVCVNKALGIYISESGLSAMDCRSIINVSEFCASRRGGWSSYTYAKQTLGCRDNDRLAFVCARPVMTACATIRGHLMDNVGTDDSTGRNKHKDKSADSVASDDAPANLSNHHNDKDDNGSEKRSAPCSKRKELVLDVREPHVVKYDTTTMERQQLAMHTDKSEWTFLIALSEGRGQNYGGGGTFFQASNTTVHLQMGQMLIFRGKLRHCGVRISSGTRYLLAGFLVPQQGETK